MLGNSCRQSFLLIAQLLLLLFLLHLLDVFFKGVERKLPYMTRPGLFRLLLLLLLLPLRQIIRS